MSSISGEIVVYVILAVKSEIASLCSLFQGRELSLLRIVWLELWPWIQEICVLSKVQVSHHFDSASRGEVGVPKFAAEGDNGSLGTGCLMLQTQ